MASRKTELVTQIMELYSLNDKKLFTLRNDTLEKILEDFEDGVFYEWVREDGKRKYIGRKVNE